MKKSSRNQTKCRECKRPILEGSLRDHWMEWHLEKLEEIDRWLGKHEDKTKMWEKVVRLQEGKENENK